MRTTLTLDPDVSRLIEDAVHRERRPMKRVVNDALRRALAPAPGPREPYRVVPHQSAILPGVDMDRLNQLADELEDEAILARVRADG
ncbi:MAG: antitoxin [Chloroflexota bacterium]